MVVSMTKKWSSLCPQNLKTFLLGFLLGVSFFLDPSLFPVFDGYNGADDARKKSLWRQGREKEFMAAVQQ